MPKDMTLLYKEFYDTYSKRYGNNTCIFLMVGKFYELYASFKQTITPVAQSVKRATEIMNILLKEKQLDDGSTEYWSGFPEQSLHKFAQTLTREGWTVVIVDQIKEAGDVIDRIPTRILSPGTHVEIANQDRMSVASLWIDKQTFSTSVLDLTTGEVFSYKTKFVDEILHMYQVYCVKEVVVAPDTVAFSQESAIRSMINITGPIQIVPQQNFSYFEDEFRREEFFRKLFRTRLLPVRPTLSLIPLQSLIEKSLTVLLRFVEDHFPQQTEQLTTHTIYSPSHHMRLSNNILEQLNILTTNNQRSLLHILDQTVSAIGKRTLRERILRPITDSNELTKRWTQIAFLQQNQNKSILERELRLLYDIPRLHHKVSSGSISSIEVLQMYSSYTASNVLMKQLQNTPLACPVHIQEQVHTYREHVKRLFDEEKASRREKDELVGFLTPIAGPKTTSFEVKIKTLSEEWKLKWTQFSKEIGISPDPFRLVKKGEMEWSWEGPRSLAKIITANAKASKVLTNVEVDTKKAGPVMVNSKEFEEMISVLLSLWSKHEKALQKECEMVCDDLWTMVKPFQNDWVDWLGSVDATLSLANVAEQYNWCQPITADSLSITGLRHPLLETMSTRVAYVKHDVDLGGDSPNGWLIYGVNASGKSSLMKAVGIACILAQAGSFVPATTFSIRPYDAAYSRIWNHDNLWAGLSSFAVEVTELRDILMNATERSLVLGDEVCSGTESTSATALVASTLEHLDKLNTHFMFATHLHDLMKIDGFLPRPGMAVWHLRVERTPDGKLVYDRRLQPGPGSSSYGLEVAHAMGIPLTVLERAHAIRRNLEGTTSSNEAPKSSWNAKLQRHSCEVCGHAVVRDLEVHHIIQRSEGGSNELRNLAVLCEDCHDKHHNGEITVGPLLQTSEGLERSTVSSETNVKVKKSNTKHIWSEEEDLLIRTTLQHLKDRPLKRVVSELADQGIHITQAQLKKFIE
jgi:DNA mismatch repair protein MutS